MSKGKKSSFLKHSKRRSLMILLAYLFPTITLIGALGLRYLEACFFGNCSAEVVLGVLFFWALYRPRLISFTFLILLGLGLDMVETSPIGWTSFVWTFFGFLVWSQRRLLIKAPFGMVWGAFSILGTLVIVMNGVVFSLIYECPLFVSRMGLISLTTIAVYPLIFYVLSYLDRRIVRGGVPQEGSTPRGVVDPQGERGAG